MRGALVLQGDCRALPLPDESVDAVVTDPPYGLAFMGKSWDHDVPGPAYWREVLRVAKPGAHLLAFGGTRTWHWLTVAVELAGWEVRDCLSWLYGTGFPKSHNFGEQIGWGEGWGTALKPAWEPVVVCRKPLAGTVAGNATVYGTGGLNIDGCRIGVRGEAQQQGPYDGEGVAVAGEREGGKLYPAKLGRWPANVTLTHTRWCRRRGTKVERRPAFEQRGDQAVVAYGDGLHGSRKVGEFDEEQEDWDCPPSCPVRMLDEQSGGVGGNTGGPAVRGEGVALNASEDGSLPRNVPDGYDDTGGASRFYYCSKASRGEREAGLPDVDGRANRHPTVKPIDLCRWLVRLVTRRGQLVLDPFMGSGSTGCATVLEGRRFVGLDLEAEYVRLARARLEHWRQQADED